MAGTLRRSDRNNFSEMQEKQRTANLGTKLRKLRPRNEERRKLVNHDKPPATESSECRRTEKVESTAVEKVKQTGSKTPNNKKIDVRSKPSKNGESKNKLARRHAFAGDHFKAEVDSLKQNIVGNLQNEKRKEKLPEPVIGLDDLSSTKCSFKVALFQNGNFHRRFRRLPKIVEEKLPSKNSAGNLLLLQSTQDSCVKACDEKRQCGDFKSEFDAITQNEKKIELLEEKLKKLSVDKESDNGKDETEPEPNGLLERGINDIQISLSELNSILKKIKSTKSCAAETADIRSTTSLTNIKELFPERSAVSLGEESINSMTEMDDVYESVPSLKVNVDSETCNELSECTQHDKSPLNDKLALERRANEAEVENLHKAHWKMAQRNGHFENELNSQVALMTQREDNVSKLQGKLREMTEDLQNTCQERIDFAFQSKRLFHVYENKLQELYKYCKLAEEEMHCLRTGREKLVDTLREQVGVQTDVDGIFEAYQHVLREKEAMKAEMRNLFGFLVEQGKAMDNLRTTVKTLTEQVDNTRREFQQQNENLSSYYESSFKEFNSDCKDLHERIQQLEGTEPAPLTLLSSCEIETFSCRRK